MEKFLSLGLDVETLSQIANQYGFDKLEYVAKFYAFRCYIKGVHVDWIDLNDVSKVQGGRDVVEIKNRYQKVTKSKTNPLRGIVNFVWRSK